jgi:hypothetical protein
VVALLLSTGVMSQTAAGQTVIVSVGATRTGQFGNPQNCSQPMVGAMDVLAAPATVRISLSGTISIALGSQYVAGPDGLGPFLTGTADYPSSYFSPLRQCEVQQGVVVPGPGRVDGNIGSGTFAFVPASRPNQSVQACDLRFVGSQGVTLSVQEPGRLYLGVNELFCCNNSGAFIASVCAVSARITAEQVTGCVRGGVTLSVNSLSGGNQSYQWQVNVGTPASPEWCNLAESVAGGSCVGTSQAVFQGVSGPVLSISGLSAADARDYRCVVSSACVSVASNATTLTVESCTGCSLADVAGGGPDGLSYDGTVDGSDFIAFINSFGIGDASVDPRADVAGGGATGEEPDGTIDGSDFIAFINAFAIGC